MRTATIYAAGDCNLRCAHCAVAADQITPRQALSTADMILIFERLAAAGVRQVTLLGGEPTYARRDMTALLDAAGRIGLEVSVNTNLLAFKYVEPLLDYPALTNLVVSLDGARSETHDAIRGRGTFARTLGNLKTVLCHPRARTGALRVDATFVLNGVNRTDAIPFVRLAQELGLSKINISHLKNDGRAASDGSRLALGADAVIESMAEVLIYWVLNGRVPLDLYVPPAVAAYLERAYGIDAKIANDTACGGPMETYGYVDLYGNHLPCPAYSREENPASAFAGPVRAVNLLERDARDIWDTNVFQGFEVARRAKTRQGVMHPCNVCAFFDQCSPCTAQPVPHQGQPEASVCAALYDHLGTHKPVEQARIFGGAGGITPAPS